MSKFQVIVLGLFIVLAVGGLITFSVFRGGAKNTQVSLTMWGTLSSDIMNNYIQALLKKEGNKDLTIRYVQVPANSIYQSYLEYLALGQGPDLLLLSQNQYSQFSNKLYSIPYASISQQTFKTSYIQAAEVYLQSTGVGAIPFTVDPLVMYWNRDIFTSSLLTNPPHYWDEVVSIAPRLTVKDATLNITTSGIALGGYKNIDNAKSILSLLMMQTGNPIIVSAGNGQYRGTLDSSSQALSFYTQFSDPLKQVYSWNNSLPTAKSLFIANRLGMYLGFSSEYSEINQKNPNLNFAVSLIPQVRPATGKKETDITFGNLYGLSVARSSANPQAAAAAALILGSQDGSIMWSQMSGLPSDRRDSLNFSSSDAKTALFAESALWSQTWTDPNPAQTDIIFSTMINNITSGTESINQASKDANDQLNALLGYGS